MEAWKEFLTDMAGEIREEVLPVVGSSEASEDVWVAEVRGKRNRIDGIAARILLRCLKESSRSVRLVSEECGDIRIGSNPKRYLVVDEVDGTTNASHGIPFSAISLALCGGPRLSNAILGVVMNLNNGDVYTAERGKGARKNGAKLRPSLQTDLEEALVVLDASPAEGESVRRIIPLIEFCKHVRHYGAAALEMCLLAEGRIDAFVDLRDRLRVTDVAASLLILREAGGVVTGRPKSALNAPLRHNEKVSFLAAGNSKLLAKIEEKLG